MIGWTKLSEEGNPTITGQYLIADLHGNYSVVEWFYGQWMLNFDMEIHFYCLINGPE